MPKQLSRSDLATMTPAEIVAADERGQLRALAEGKDPSTYVGIPDEGQLSLSDLQRMSYAEIVAAEDAGRFDVALGKRPAADDETEEV
jgi:hypothetical protein